MKFLIFIGFFLIFNTVYCEAIPAYKCSESGTSCTFSDIVLNATHYDWEPIADNPLAIEEIIIRNSIVPVITNNICQKFPNVKKLLLTSIQVEKVLEEAFMGCTKVEDIILYQNKIKTLEKNTFYNNPEVKVLYLYSNQITHFGDNNIFKNMPNLEFLSIYDNNLTEFSPDLIRYNQKLEEIYMYSNNLLNLDVEKMIDFVPALKLIWLNDNQISCSRMVQILNYFKQKDISTFTSSYDKIRYFPKQKVFGDYICLPDSSWMSAHYKNDNENLKIIIDEKIKAIEKQEKYIIEQNDQILKMLRKLVENEQ